jgi:peptidoglycan hydrolase-like protein with peptidoglycan-binding domain
MAEQILPINLAALLERLPPELLQQQPATPPRSAGRSLGPTWAQFLRSYSAPPTLAEEARAPQQPPMPQPPAGPAIDYSNAAMSGTRPGAEATRPRGPLSELGRLDRTDRAAVKAAQEALQAEGLYLHNSAGRPLTPDGIFGPAMAQAIVDYQRIANSRPSMDMRGSVMAPEATPPMPPTLSGEENPPEVTREPFRPRGRVLANVAGTVAGGAGGAMVGGPVGAVAGGAAGSAGAGQLYDAAADYMMGTQERAPILSGQTATDAALGAVAGPVGPALRAAGNVAARAPATSAALAAGGLTVAAPGSAEPPDALSTARETIAKLRQRQSDLEAEEKQLKAEQGRFGRLDRTNKAAVQKAQEDLQAEGLYLRNNAGRPLTPDGIFGPGMGQAIEDYQRRLAKRLETNSTSRGNVGRDLETQGGRLKGLEGGERLRQAEQNVGPVSRALRDYGEIGGTVAGLALGGLGRWGMTRHANRVAAERAADVEARLGRNMTNVPQRAGRLGEVWREGGRGDAPPFTPAPGTRYGLQVNPNAAPTGELFTAPRGIRGQVRGSDLAVMGGSAVEAGIAETRLWQATERLEAATRAAQSDPSDINIAELQQARDEVAFWQSMGRVGQAGVAGYGVASTKLPRNYPRPDLSQADREVANLNRLISPPKATRKRK